ncbi:hypothetical protein MYCTH_2107298 [Thermothelomyces thermophilus ATCC 42464]|uniref:Uncharacterized protein n=1 Tax=Thermothelomyces thermophilus (strain ATCC 42464 / BCRC 31852 / DSM 1799) TaxID=573729 RepID=G2Q538_THET4|nr:uncharacterized protein MYCTH_2107298 [Thermothelomyces thermophilus ATCC 42464]AEO54576.1 hypothetical protein MYCTH_2107298 [Thermothelomyces thermophilus ATCC 42464]
MATQRWSHGQQGLLLWPSEWLREGSNPTINFSTLSGRREKPCSRPWSPETEIIHRSSRIMEGGHWFVHSAFLPSSTCQHTRSFVGDVVKKNLEYWSARKLSASANLLQGAIVIGEAAISVTSRPAFMRKSMPAALQRGPLADHSPPPRPFMVMPSPLTKQGKENAL